MGLQLSVAARNARLDAIEAEWGASPILQIAAGAQPANCAAGTSGTILATMTLPVDSMAAASGGVKAKLGTWEDPVADGTGIAAHFRIYKSDGVTCVLQGSVTLTGGGGIMTIDNTNIVAGQDVVVTTFSLTDGNA